MRAVFLAITLTLGIACAFPQKKGRTSESVRKEQTQVRDKMSKTQRQIDDNKARTAKQLRQLNSLNSQITATNQKISQLQGAINATAAQEAAIGDSIAAIARRYDTLQQQYAKALRESRKRRVSMSELSLIFAAPTFNNALKRASYIRQLEGNVTDKAQALRQLQETLQKKRQQLEVLRAEKERLAAQLRAEASNLAQQQAQTQTLVSDLNKEASTLAQVLGEQQHQARNLDNELTRIIEQERQAERRRAEEERRAEERRRLQEKKQQKQAQQQTVKDQGNDASGTKGKKDKKQAGSGSKGSDRTVALSGSFASNKGRLIYPVGGKTKVVSGFGVHQHSDLRNVQTDNPGIDIEASAGSNARAVYDGEVSGVYSYPGYQNVVMVRHGEYITVYGNIDRLDVKKGDKVKTGQTIGHIYSDPSDNGRTILHFEVRRETQKLNPAEWISK